MAGDGRVKYLLDASRLWWEFKHWRQAYVLLLRAEDQAHLDVGPRAESVQHALLDFESAMALDRAVRHRAPEAGFWTCLVARRTRMVLDLPLEEAWQELQSSVCLEVAPSRALEAVQVVAMAHFCGLKVGSLEAAAAYVSHAPRSLKELYALRSFVQSLLRWERLDPVTLPWLGVLEAVVEKPAGA